MENIPEISTSDTNDLIKNDHKSTEIESTNNLNDFQSKIGLKFNPNLDCDSIKFSITIQSKSTVEPSIFLRTFCMDDVIYGCNFFRFIQFVGIECATIG